MPGLTASINSASTGRFTSPGPTTPVISPADLPSPDHLAIINERRLSDDHSDEEEEHGRGSLDHHDHDHDHGDLQREEDEHEHDDDHLDNDPFPPLRERELRATPTGTGPGLRLHTAWPQKKSDIHWLHVDPLSPPLSSGDGRRHHMTMGDAVVSQVSLVSTKTATTTRGSPGFARFFKRLGEDKLMSEEEREERKRRKKEEEKTMREKMQAEKAQRELEMPMPMVMMGGGRAF